VQQLDAGGAQRIQVALHLALADAETLRQGHASELLLLKSKKQAQDPRQALLRFSPCSSWCYAQENLLPLS